MLLETLKRQRRGMIFIIHSHRMVIDILRLEFIAAAPFESGTPSFNIFKSYPRW
jgi:hypothetical protein